MPDRSLDAPLTSPQPVVGLAQDYPPGHRIAAHRHPRIQLVHAVAGVMSVTTAAGSWVVPPGHALWVPAALSHAITCHGAVSMRTLYLDPRHPGCRWPGACVVVTVSELAQALIVRAIALTGDHDVDGPAGRLVQVLLDELAALPVAPLHLPMPRDRRLLKLTRTLVECPEDARRLEDWAGTLGTTSRTLARLFRRETGLTFREWRQRRRLLAALERLSSDGSVTRVALGVGYVSPSAFVAAFRRAFGVTPGRYLASDRSPPERRGSAHPKGTQAGAVGRSGVTR